MQFPRDLKKRQIIIKELKMDLDVIIDQNVLSIHIDNPFRLDIEDIFQKIDEFANKKGISLNGLDIKGLIPKMVRGIAGCEGGCPANALQLVESGFKNFNLSYIEGGILIAKAQTSQGSPIELKMFPEF
jgi:hypothetical protein